MFNEAIAAGSPSQRVASIGKVVDAWAAAHQRVKALRSCRSRLESDLEALACGARTVVMLDYTPGLTSKGLKWAVEHLSSWWPCGAMTLEGCPYLVNLTTLTAQCRAMCCDHAGAAECSAGTAPPAFEPVLVGFKAKMGGDGSGVVPVVLGEDAHKAVFRQLKGLVDALETHQARGSTAVLDLEAVPGLPLIPTLNGLLLGYPVVYVVDGGMDGAAAAGRALSAESLTLISGHAVLLSVGNIVSGAGDEGRQHASAVGMGPDVLSAFSVPSQMWNAGCDMECKADKTTTDGGSEGALNVIQAAVRAWAAHLEAALHGSGLQWQGWRAQSVGIRSVSL